MFALIRIIICVLATATCHGQVMKTPLVVANPFHLFQQLVMEMQKPSDDVVSLAKNITSLILNDRIQSFLHATDVDDACANALEEFVKDVFNQTPYALTMLDSWGKLESGILNINLKWVGSYSECVEINATTFQGKYCTVYVGEPTQVDTTGLGSLPLGVTVGGCFPDLCSESNLSFFLSPLVTNKNLSLELDCPVQFTDWRTKDILGLVVCVFFITIVIASTGYDYITMHTSFDLTSPDRTQLVDDNTAPAHGIFHKLTLSFSLIQNTNRLLSTKQRPTDIRCLHGLRFFSITWVILGHSFAFSFPFSNNLKFIAKYFLNHWEFQAIANGTYSVDAFFFLSGLLVVYLGLRQLGKNGGRISVLKLYLYRYLRLTPLYAFLILMSISLWPKFGSGPFWPALVQRQENACEKYWYTNLLYFNNLYPSKISAECYAWGWYLACDTQFFLLSPFLLYLLYHFPVWGIAANFLLALASISITGAFSAYTNQQMQSLGAAQLAKYVIDLFTLPLGNATTMPDVLPLDQNQYIYDLYTKPWCRISSYLVGIITGYILHVNHNKVKMSKVVAVVGWFVAAGTSCAILYCVYPSFSYPTPPSVSLSAFYNALCRPLWCACLAWLTIACVSGYGGPVDTFLSWKLFIPLSRLTYSVYLVHPLILWWLLGNQESLIHFSIPIVIMIFLATLVLSNLVAYVLAVVVEFPIVEIMKVLLNRDGNTAVGKQTTDASTPEADIQPPGACALKLEEEHESE